jgi:hyperosmotically inducible protein
MKQQNLVIAVVLLLAASTASFSGSVSGRRVGAALPDNSRENAILTRQASLTAQDQPNDRQDRDTAASIRRVIVHDDTLSTYAQNVKIIVAHGNVTLEGPVHSDDERQELAFDAATIVNPASILNKVVLT